MDIEKVEYETQLTIKNRELLFSNANLLYWYKKLYEEQFSGFSDVSQMQVLEIGSGTSPLKIYYPNVKTSDIMRLEYLDYVFDAHEIHELSYIKDDSLDIITLTNVLHHLENPCEFLLRASRKLKKGGSVIFAEPYMSILSRVIYTKLHYEPTDFSITEPKLSNVEGPLSSANNALPYMIFSSDWSNVLREMYLFSMEKCLHFSSISYMATGGIKRKFPIPGWAYKLFFGLDMKISKLFPKLTASFFILKLTKK